MYLKIFVIVFSWNIVLSSAELNTSSEQYIGCYKDRDPKKAVLARFFERKNPHQTIEHCLEVCANKFKKYAGLENGKKCFCGDIYLTRGTPVEAGCNKTCTGSQTQYCGGSSLTSIYRVCPRNCAATCSKEGECRGCKDGYWGKKCKEKCKNACHKKRCEQSSRKCSYCSANSDDEDCTNRCAPNCASHCLRDSGECASCNDGFWGIKCEHKCSENCKVTCDHKTGQCTSCKDSYWGDNCTKSCPDNCKGGCDQSSGHCVECEPQWYGDTCDKQCSDKCDDKGCDKGSGVCHNCKPGYYGDNCSASCGKCEGNVCAQEDGSCLNCMTGYYGDDCSTPCGKCKGNICEQDDGSCQSCKPGYHGDGCKLKCGANCRDGICKKADGTCNLGCNNGFFFSDCSEKCPQNCDTRCNQNEGECSEGCTDGYFGQKCSSECPEYCHASKCDQQKGLCSQGCKDGYFGATCAQSCPMNCHTACDNQTGTCSHGCVDGQYGDNCETSCPMNCAKNKCNQTDGSCTFGCQAGWLGDKCTDACLNGSYGDQCAKTCHCAEEVPCDAVSGQCDHGCAQGWTGPACSQAARTGTSDASSAGATRIIAGGIAGGVLLLVIVIAIVVAAKFKRRRATESNKDDSMENGTPETPDYNLRPGMESKNTGGKPLTHSPHQDAEDGQEKRGAIDYEGKEGSAAPTTLHKDELKQHMKTGDLITEYQMLPTDQKHPWTVAAKACNKSKNRYRGIQAYDHSRVVLEPINGDLTTDYINASYMPGYKKEKAYIAAQGVTGSTVEDMWRMVWQVGARIIVITTNLKEGDKVKCVQYWPDTGSQTYGEVTVDMSEERVKKDYVIRKFVVQKEGERREIHQFHFTGWPDHGVPENAASLVNFRHLIRHRMQNMEATDAEDEAPVIVHCSAGIGRTGTYIALDYLLEQAEDQDSLDVPACLSKLRQARVSMVQNLGQYLFLYKAVHEGIFVGNTVLTRDDLREYNKENVKSQHKILLEAKKALNTSDKEWTITSTQLTPTLPERTMVCCTAPTSDRATDLWERVSEEKWQTIVLLTLKQEQKDGRPLLPEKNSPITLSSGREVHEVHRQHGTITAVSLKLTEASHLYANTASPEDQPVAVYENVEMMKKDDQCHVIVVNDRSRAAFVEAWKKMAAPTQTAIFGTSKEASGVFAICLALCDELKAFGEVDVFSAVRKAQSLYPGLMDDMEDYQFLYTALQSVSDE